MKKYLYILVLLSSVFFFGWGSTGHKLINRKAGLSFPVSMNHILWFADSIAYHGSDADWRKNTDPSEEYRHYIDIEYYPEYLSTGRIPQNWDSLVARHSLNFVINNGYVPFAIIATTDSVKKYFQQRNWQMAMLKAADLGHYVGDAYNPLHCTRYYNGWSSYSNGIHSRYETSLINRDSGYIQFTGSNVSYINDINNFAFDIVYTSNSYVDSVYSADSIAHTIAGNTTSNLYFQEFWNRAGYFTINFFKNASYKLACLIYTAWVDAGSPVIVSANGISVNDFKLTQNYPNPFNNISKIKYTINKPSDVKINLYDIKGNEIFTLVNGFKNSGEYEVVLNGSNLASGTYFYRLIINNKPLDFKKAILLK